MRHVKMNKPDNAFNPARRRTLKTAGLALGAGMLPFAPAFSQTIGQSAGAAAAGAARYRRYNASKSKSGARMLQSYARAVRAMLALPPEDPRNWYRHAMIHTMDCPHGNWWFLSWHRGYLGWFEQICRELSGDPEFALPYWDWTTEQKVPAGMFEDVLDPNHSAFIPTAQDFESRLKAALGNADYWTSPNGVFSPQSQFGLLLRRGMRFDADLMFDIVSHPAGKLFYDQPGARGIRRELPDFSVATREAVAGTTIQAALAAPDFITFASAKTSNHSAMGGFSVLEAKPHNAVHRCVGTRDCNFIEPLGFMNDMLSSADPLFYLHHANIDRLWDVWTRKQIRLGLPYLPDGVELRTDLPDEQKSAEERNTDYYRWAREPMLFFVDAKGKPVSKTRGGDYEATAAFGYDYEPGAGEEVMLKGPRPVQRRVFTGKVLSRVVQGARAGSASVQVPAAVIAQAGAGTGTLVANITLKFAEMPHDPFIVILNGPDDPTQVDANSPYYLGTISMFGGHHGHAGALSFAFPLGDRLLPGRPAAADGGLRVRVLPLHAAMGHHGMEGENTVELLGVEIEVY